MKIAVIDDYQNAFKTLKCFPKLTGHEVSIYTDPETDMERFAERLKDADAVVLTQQRTAFRGPDREVAETEIDRPNRTGGKPCRFGSLHG